MAQHKTDPSGTEPNDNVRSFFAYKDSQSRSSEARMYGGGSGGGSGGVRVDSETKNYLDANMRAVRAENSSDFARLEGKLDQIPNAPSIWQIAGVAGATLGAAVAIAAFAYDRFDGGLAASAIVDSAVERISTQQSQRDAAQDARLDRILEVLEAKGDQPQESPTEGQN